MQKTLHSTGWINNKSALCSGKAHRIHEMKLVWSHWIKMNLTHQYNYPSLSSKYIQLWFLCVWFEMALSNPNQGERFILHHVFLNATHRRHNQISPGAAQVSLLHSIEYQWKGSKGVRLIALLWIKSTICLQTCSSILKADEIKSAEKRNIFLKQSCCFFFFCLFIYCVVLTCNFIVTLHYRMALLGIILFDHFKFCFCSMLAI